VLYNAVLFPGTHKRRYRRLARFGHALGLHEEQLALSEPEKRLTTLRIGALAEHLLTTFRSSKNYLGEPLV
jgi:hypothetical protein